MQILLATNNKTLVSTIKRCLSRFQYEFVVVDNGLDGFQKAITQKFNLLILSFDLPRMSAIEILRRMTSLGESKIVPAIILTVTENQRMKVETEHFSRTEVLPRPMAIRKFVGLVQQILHQGIRVSSLGGGTGLFTLLSGLKTLSGLQLTSIVSMSDDGGSTGQLKDIFGILPPGDIRRSLVALSTAPDLLNELMQYRFDRGPGLKGHSLGNLLLTALSKMHGNMSQAVKSIGEILNIQGEVIPVTDTINTLKAELENGAIIEGEHRIDLFEDHDPNLTIRRIWQEPKVTANPDALEALLNSKVIIIGPGDLYTSVVSNLIVGGIRESITASKAKKIYICNVMTKPGETTNFSVSDHVREIVKYLEKDILDYVLCSETTFSRESLETYAKKNQKPVIEKKRKTLANVTRANIVWADVASEDELVRHDSLKLAMEMKKIFDREKLK